MMQANTTDNTEILMYGRTTFCPYQRIARRVFEQYNIPIREIMIDQNPEALERVINWTGFRSVPTIIVTLPGEFLPYEEPAPLTVSSPRGVDRGSMITEPSENELVAWLTKHGFLSA